MTAAWECPACGRRFGRRGQGHVCAPAMSIDEYFAARSPVDREIFEAVAEHLQGLGPVDVEAVGVGILFKEGRTFVELRPRRIGMGLSMIMPRSLDHPRVSRRMRATGSRFANVVPLRSAEEVDDEVRAWLTESYLSVAER